MNNVKVFGLMALLTGLVVALGGAVGGQGGMLIAFVMAGAMNFFMYWTSSSIVLRMYGALFGRGDEEEDGGAGGLVMMILAPIAASLVQMAISRQREFKADAVGAEICGRPLALAGALEKLDAYARRIPMNVSPAAAPLAQVNPLAAYGGGIVRLFSTHPPTAERVAALRQIAGRGMAAHAAGRS